MAATARFLVLCALLAGLGECADPTAMPTLVPTSPTSVPTQVPTSGPSPPPSRTPTSGPSPLPSSLPTTTESYYPIFKISILVDCTQVNQKLTGKTNPSPSNETYAFSLGLTDSHGRKYTQRKTTDFEGLGYATPDGQHVSWKDVKKSYDREDMVEGDPDYMVQLVDGFRKDCTTDPGTGAVTCVNVTTQVRSCGETPLSSDDENRPEYADFGGFAVVWQHVSE